MGPQPAQAGRLAAYPERGRPTCGSRAQPALYLGEPVGDALIRRLVSAGGRVVPARNPYWERWGVTIADPDGYRLVLSRRT
jgi:hypothetical protein